MHYTHGNYSIRFETPEAAETAQGHIRTLLEAAAELAGGVVVQQSVITSESKEATLPVETRTASPDLAKDPDLQIALDMSLSDCYYNTQLIPPGSPGVIRRGIQALIHNSECKTVRDVFIWGRQPLGRVGYFKGGTSAQTFAFFEERFTGLKVYETPSAAQIAAFCPDLAHVPLLGAIPAAQKEIQETLDPDSHITVAEARNRINLGQLVLPSRAFRAFVRFESDFTAARQRYENR